MAPKLHPGPLGPMAGRKAACAAVLGWLVALGLALAATAEHPAQELPTTELNETASSVSELLGALNRTQGSDKSITITLLSEPRRLPPLAQLPHRIRCAGKRQLGPMPALHSASADHWAVLLRASGLMCCPSAGRLP